MLDIHIYVTDKDTMISTAVRWYTCKLFSD